MKIISQKTAFKLPYNKRWGQLKITGKPVSVKQAKDIIFKTDFFIINSVFPFFYGDTEWATWANTLFGLKNLHTFINNAIKNNSAYVSQFEDFRAYLQEKLGWISTDYVGNDWANSSFAYGPHGWCSPGGKIAYIDNIGKNPNIEAVFHDFEKIAKAFPYLEMTATLMDGERIFSDEEKKPFITFVIKDSNVQMTNEHDEHHYHHDFPVRDDEYHNPQGLPKAWIIDYGKAIKPVVEEAFQLYFGQHEEITNSPE